MKYFVLTPKGITAWAQELDEWFDSSDISSENDLGMFVMGDDRIYFNTATQRIIGGEYCGGRADSYWKRVDMSYTLSVTQELQQELNGSEIILPDEVKVI